MNRQNEKTLLLLLLFTLVGGLAVPALARDIHGGAQTITRSGSQASLKGPSEWFTGSARIDPLFPANTTAQYSGAYVTFEPGARSAWHIHPAGQHILVTSGVGRTGGGDQGRRRDLVSARRQTLAWRLTDNGNDAHRDHRFPERQER